MNHLHPSLSPIGSPVTIETEEDLEGLKAAGRVVALALRAMRQHVGPGMTTAELDAIGKQVLDGHGARSAPKLVYGFPGTNCISVNDEAVHGVPGDRILRSGDLVKIDVTAELNGYIADAAITVPLHGATPRATSLARAARSAFQRAQYVARAGRPINAIGHAIEQTVKRHGFTVLPELFSHGVGRTIHEAPSYPQYFDRRFKQPLWNGLVITIEPIISAGRPRSFNAGDGWTIRTADGALSAHHEHTIVITRGAPLVVTAL
jgi:methionyl aminopeptidase